MSEEYKCYRCGLEQYVPLEEKMIERVSFKESKRPEYKISLYYESVDGRGKRYKGDELRGRLKYCEDKYCDNRVFICRWCHESTLHHLKPHNIDYNKKLCVPCEQLKKDRGDTIIKELEKITTHGYNTFGDISNIVVEYLV